MQKKFHFDAKCNEVCANNGVAKIVLVPKGEFFSFKKWSRYVCTITLFLWVYVNFTIFSTYWELKAKNWIFPLNCFLMPAFVDFFILFIAEIVIFKACIRKELVPACMSEYIYRKLNSIAWSAWLLILSYKISIFTFTKTVLERRYLEMIGPV